MLDNQFNPNQIDDSQADISPYKIPAMIWELIEPYFETKYKIQVVDNYPDTTVTGPTITWTVVRRIPGREGSKIHGKGANFTNFLKVSPEGFVHEVYTQTHTVYFEYNVFTVSTELAEDIVWDVERAILECVGVMQDKIEGFQLVFDQQTMDTSMLWRQQDELVRRTIRFQAIVPVRYTRLVPQLRFIEIVESWGRLAKENVVLSRSSSEKEYHIAVDIGQKVIGISYVYLQANDGWKALELGTDYRLRRDTDQQIYIEWLDDFGKVPSVGEDFRVDYEITQLVKSHNITPQ